MFAYVSSTCGLQEESELSVEGFCLFQYFTVCRNDTIVGQLKAFNVFFFFIEVSFSKFRKYFLFFSPPLYQRDLDLIIVPWILSLEISSFWRILSSNSFNMSVFSVSDMSETLFSSSLF